MKRIANLHASTSLPLPFSLVPSYFLCAAGFPPFRASLTACFVPVVESTAMSCAAAVSVAENSTTWPFSLSASTTAWSTRRAVPSPIAFWFSAHNTFGKSWWCIRGASIASRGDMFNTNRLSNTCATAVIIRGPPLAPSTAITFGGREESLGVSRTIVGDMLDSGFFPARMKFAGALVSP
mgnify:CR=1 FL=1